MKTVAKCVFKSSVFIVLGLIVAWVSYWAGFSKSLQIGLYINQRHDLSQALEYTQLVTKLDSGKVEEVRSHLLSLSEILKEQANVKGAESSTFLDVLVPTGGISLLRDYNANHDRTKSSQSDSQM